MELYASDLCFRGENEKERAYDYCIHGKVILKIGNKLLSDDTEWCVSTSAYRFLHTLFKNHFMGTEQFLIPCCGHTMLPSDDKKSIRIFGCGNGIDFNIIHEEGNVTIVTEDNTKYCVPFTDYKNAVISFAKQVMAFYQANPPRKFQTDFEGKLEKKGFSAFIAEWYSLYNKAMALENDVPTIKAITFEDYKTYTEKEIADISKKGISLTSFDFINFKECDYNFKQTEGGLGKCVGKRDITDLSFTFYTSPKPTMIIFIEKNKFIEFITKENTVSRFHKLQKQIMQYGYRTCDMS